jgi:hypothetical protein
MRDFRTPKRAEWTPTPDWSRGYDDACAGREEAERETREYRDGYSTWMVTHPARATDGKSKETQS